MADLLFTVLVCLTLVCALGVVFSRNAVNGAMCLFLCLAGIAGLLVRLDAFLLAFLLVLVYAGAVVALFLFIIMLLDVRGRTAGTRRPVAGAMAVAALVALAAGLAGSAVRSELPSASSAAVPALGASLKLYADALFTTYLLPVEVIGFLLLIAMLGVIVLSHRRSGGPPPAKSP